MTGLEDILTRPVFLAAAVAMLAIVLTTLVALRLTAPSRRRAKERGGAGRQPEAARLQPAAAETMPVAPVGGSVAAGTPVQPRSGHPRRPEAPVAPAHPAVTFADVAGLEHAIAELREVAEYLSDPERFRALGAELPRGILLYGLPGCGKTLLARCLAGETGVPFYYASAAGFVEQFVGLGAARVRQLFDQAKQTAPCIVFIDELDAIGRRRDADPSGGREFDHTLNQLLVELDGFLMATGVLILGATNRPELIDPALLRPGRFDRRIEIGHPDREGREKILRLHASKRPFSGRVDWTAVAAGTAGLSAAELANLVNEAALLAARRHRPRILPEDVEEAATRVVSGTRNSRIMGEDEKQLVAVHEAGHALLSVLLRGMKPPPQVSIVSRTGAFDRSVWSSADDREIQTKRELMAQLIVLLGGRAAELNVFGEPSTRAEDDLRHAATLARRMVERWAMTGRFDLAGRSSDAAGGTLALGPGGQDVAELLARAEQTARIILRDNAGRLAAIAGRLVEHETLTAAELEALAGEERTTVSSTLAPAFEATAG